MEQGISTALNRDAAAEEIEDIAVTRGRKCARSRDYCSSCNQGIYGYKWNREGKTSAGSHASLECGCTRANRPLAGIIERRSQTDGWQSQNQPSQHKQPHNASGESGKRSGPEMQASLSSLHLANDKRETRVIRETE